MKYILASLSIAAVCILCGCKSTCRCGCPYCCNGQYVDYNTTTNKPAADIPIWWKEDKQ